MREHMFRYVPSAAKTDISIPEELWGQTLEVQCVYRLVIVVWSVLNRPMDSSVGTPFFAFDNMTL